MSEASNRPEEIHQHSGWLIPLAFLGVILVLSALFLLYDLRPAPGPRAGRTADEAPVALTVGNLRLTVPANYLDSRAARAGGEQEALMLSALLPDMRGYSSADAKLFAGNPPDSPLVHLQFKGGESDLEATERLARVYRPYLAAPTGKEGDFGLVTYGFRADSAYGRHDLFAGEAAGRQLLFLCERANPELPSPNCLVTGHTIASHVSFSWRFKRAYLARWREIATGVDGMLTRFQKTD
ncbi:MAG TPA: hypothetical protein VJ798_11340 [Rhizomicrobium sp.]|nr:hypothetical protein [Rhizomicrobium sp.]